MQNLILMFRDNINIFGKHICFLQCLHYKTEHNIFIKMDFFEKYNCEM